MKYCIRTTLAILAAACWGASANAALIVNDNFDGYADQAAFQTAWPAIGTAAPQSAELSTAQSASPTKSIRVPGNTTNGLSRNRLTFADTTPIAVGNTLVWSFDFYDSAPTASPARNFANLQDTTGPTSSNQLISMGLNNNQSGGNSGGQFYMARILGYSPPAADPDGGPGETGTLGSGAYFKLNDFGVGARTLGWHNLKVSISTDDGLSTDFRFYVDGILAEKVSNFSTAATFRAYDNITIGSAVSNASTEAFFDNMRLETVPEPATFVLVGLIGVAMCGGRRRVA